MHDGYLFTLGICGTASDASIAPAVLGAALRAIPAVKRAALLGDVRRDGERRDALVAAVAADAADAELLIIVTPPVAGGLPLRLAAALHTVSGHGGVLPAAGALLILVADEGEPAPMALAQLREWCAAIGASEVGMLALPGDMPADQQLDQAAQAAKIAYEQMSAALRAQGVTHER
jgi:NAD(P)H-dependent FMN reductase